MVAISERLPLSAGVGDWFHSVAPSGVVTDPVAEKNMIKARTRVRLLHEGITPERLAQWKATHEMRPRRKPAPQTGLPELAEEFLRR